MKLNILLSFLYQFQFFAAETNWTLKYYIRIGSAGIESFTIYPKIKLTTYINWPWYYNAGLRRRIHIPTQGWWTQGSQII